MDIPIWLVILFILIFIIIVVLAIWFAQPSENGTCIADDLMDEQEAWTAYKAGILTENPFYLVAPDSNGPFSLVLESIPKADTTCQGCGATNIPFPAFCLIKSPNCVETRYTQSLGQTGEVREYTYNDQVLNLGPNCQTPSISLDKGYPIPEWFPITNFQGL